MNISLILFIFIPLLLLICLIAIWRKLSSPKIKSLILGSICGIILSGIGIWVASIAFIGGGGSWSTLIYFFTLFFMVGFILGLCLYWIYRLIDKYLKVHSTLLKVFIALCITIILACGLDKLVYKFLGVPVIGASVGLLKMLDYGSILTPLFR